MAKTESHDQKMSRIAGELGAVLRQQAAGTWQRVRTGERSEGRRHAWKFRPTPDASVRYLRVTHEAMDESPVQTLLSHLTAGRWLDRLDDGHETSLVLNAGGRLERYKQQ